MLRVIFCLLVKVKICTYYNTTTTTTTTITTTTITTTTNTTNTITTTTTTITTYSTTLPTVTVTVTDRCLLCTGSNISQLEPNTDPFIALQTQSSHSSNSRQQQELSYLLKLEILLELGEIYIRK